MALKSKLTSEISGPLKGVHHNEQTTDIRNLDTKLTELEEVKADLIEVNNLIDNAINNLKSDVPEAYDTLIEIADKFGDNDDVVAGILTTIGLKANASDVAAAIAGISFTAIRPVITVTGAHTAVAGQRVLADSTGGAFNVTLPQDPAQGATVDVDPVGFGVSVVPNPAGAATTIEGHSSITIDQSNVGLTLTLRGTVWKIERRSIVNG